MSPEVVLIVPPLWDMYGPPASTPALLGHLASAGISGAQIDLNQIFFREVCDDLLTEACEDLADRQSFETKIPHEHKVVLGARDFTSNLLERHGIDRADLSFDAYRSNIAQWDTGRLNVIDALIHYGYFIRRYPVMRQILEHEESLHDDIWSRLRETFFNHCIQLINREKPLLVGFSILGEQQLPGAIACSYWLREVYDGTIVWGGSDIRYTFEKMQKESAWWRELTDYICLGEGETALLKLVELCRSGRARHTGKQPDRQDLEMQVPSVPSNDSFPLPVLGGVGDVPGLLSGPFLGRSLPAKNYESMSSLACYSFEGFDLNNGYLMPEPVIAYQASRGCHWGICAFCDHEEGYRLHYRPKSAKQVVDDMEVFRTRYGAHCLQFVDEAIEPEWLDDFMNELERRNLAGVYRWSHYSKVSEELTGDMLKRAQRLGCRMVLFGVESFNQRLLKLVRKGISRRQILRVLRDTNEAGLRCWIWLISGLPTQTRDELSQDIQDLASAFDFIDSASVGRYRISANSDLAREPGAFGIVSYDFDSPTDVVCEHNGEVIDPQHLADLFYSEYYPLAIERSRSHNRYLIFYEAIKNEGTRATEKASRDGNTPKKPRRVTNHNVSISSQEVAGPGDL